MANIRIHGLIARTNKAGLTRWYWQPSATLKAAGWKPLVLGKDRNAAMQAAERRNAEIATWKAGGGKPGEVKKRILADTLGALIARYIREVINGTRANGNPFIADTTAKTYRTSLKRLDLWAGNQPLAFITSARVRVLRDTLIGPADRGGIGNYPAHKTLSMGSTLFKFAVQRELVDKNPFANFGLEAPDPRAAIWSPPAREAFVAAADAAGEPNMALAVMLAFATGQREGDLLRMSIANYVAIPEHKMNPEDYAIFAARAPDGVPRGIRIRQRKTGAWIEVPVVGEVRRRIEDNISRTKTHGLTTLLFDDKPAWHWSGRNTGETTGKPRPWAGERGQTRFQRRFAELREAASAAAADIATVQFRDLRRTCVVYLGELGLDAHLIAAITGHDIDATQGILKTYMPLTTGRSSHAIALSLVREERETARNRENDVTIDRAKDAL
jgi:integrase